MTRITLTPPERSLPTNVPYRSDRIAGFTVELDVPDAMLGEMKAAFLAHVARLRDLQVADLDAQELLLRARYDMPTPRPSPVAEPGGDFTTADRLPAVAVQAANAPRTTPPPSSLRDVSDGTVDELRRLAGQLSAAGDSTEWAPPATEADAQALLPKMRARLYDLTKKPAAPGPDFYAPDAPAKATASIVTMTGKKVDVPTTPAERRCSHFSHKEPRFLTTEQAAASLARSGKMLCPAHGGT